jgi:hypothetical protein
MLLAFSNIASSNSHTGTMGARSYLFFLAKSFPFFSFQAHQFVTGTSEAGNTNTGEGLYSILLIMHTQII